MKKPGILFALFPIVLIIVLLSSCIAVFGGDATEGPIQIALLVAAVITAVAGMAYLKTPWKHYEDCFAKNFQDTAPVIMLLMMIGALTATWMLSGVVPAMIYYGLKIISPKVFIVMSFVLCSVISILSGSSWTTVGTIGVALFGAGRIIGMPTGWMAGAIISGAYFGDMISPVSDIVNMASNIAGTDLYKHIKYAALTAVPTCIVCLVVFTIVGLSVDTPDSVELGEQLNQISSTFHISPWLMLIPVFTFILVIKKVPATLTLFFSAVAAGIVACLAQPQLVGQIIGDAEGFKGVFMGILKMMSSKVSIETGFPMLDSLVCTSGVSGMINTIWLLMCIMIMSGVLTACGSIEVITNGLLKFAKNTTSMVATTAVSCIFCNLVLADQYISILVPANMFKSAYRRKGLAPELLSRTLGDVGAVTSVLVPWNTCAVVQSSVLGVATLAYLPYCTFCLAAPVITILIAALNFKIHHVDPETGEPVEAAKKTI